MRRVLRRDILGGLVLIALVSAVTWWVVERYKRPGQMSLLQAQAMDMGAMRAPEGTQPVAAETVAYGPIEGKVTYTGTAVAYTDEDVYPRVTGRIVSLPVYAGDRVRPGQLIVRLDSEELRGREAEAAAEKAAAGAGSAAAAAEAAQTRTMLSQAEAEIAKAKAEAAEAEQDRAGAVAMVAQAEQEVNAAGEQEAAAKAEWRAAQADEAQARAEVASAQAHVEYWSAEVERMQDLLDQGAVSLDEFQREKAEAQAAAAGLASAQAIVRRKQANVETAEKRVAQASAGLEKAKASLAGAKAAERATAARQDRAGSSLRSVQAQARAAALAVQAAEARQAEAKAKLASASASLTTNAIVRGYTEIRAATEGVVVERTVSPGVLVMPGMRILKIAQIDPIRVQANVAEKDAALIKVGAPVQVRTQKEPSATLSGKVTSVFPATDPQSRTSIVEAALPNRDRRVLPGDYVSVDIAYGRKERALTVPLEALVTVPVESGAVTAEKVREAVWVVASASEQVEYTCPMHPEVISDKPGNCPKCGMKLVPKTSGTGQRAHLAEVTVGLRGGGRAEIVTGVSPGDQVIYAGYEELREGNPVFVTAWGKEGPLQLPPPPAGAAMPGMEHGTPGMAPEKGRGQEAMPGMSHETPETNPKKGTGNEAMSGTEHNVQGMSHQGHKH